MLKLLFHVGEDRYVIDCKLIQEIVPRVNLSPAREMPPYVAGYLNYKGEPVVIIDFCRLLSKRSAEFLMHTRIILIKLEDQGALFGIIAEKVIGMIEEDEDAFQNPAFSVGRPDFLGPVMSDETGVVQQVDPEGLYRVLNSGSAMYGKDI